VPERNVVGEKEILLSFLFQGRREGGRATVLRAELFGGGSDGDDAWVSEMCLTKNGCLFLFREVEGGREGGRERGGDE